MTVLSTRRVRWLATVGMVGLLCACAIGALDSTWIVERPEIRVGDRWAYSIRTQRPTGISGDRIAMDEAIAVTPDSMTVRRAMAGSSDAPVESVFQRDWTRLRTINGVPTTIARDLSFPLRPGKTWSNSYLDTKPGNPAVTLRRTYRYRVVARETIAVAAGRFDTIRIETTGGWQLAAGEPNPRDKPAADSPDAASLRFTSWYAPALGRFVRFEEDVQLPSGVVFSHTVIELRSVTLRRER